MGVVVINNTAKLNPLNDKVKFFEWQLLTVVFTFLFFSVVHILWIHFFVVCLHHRNGATPKQIPKWKEQSKLKADTTK